MKYILLLQAFIIIALAGYIYTQSQVPVTPTVLEEVLPQLEGVTESAPEPLFETPPATSSLEIAGPNDSGMEWPDYTGTSSLQVR